MHVGSAFKDIAFLGIVARKPINLDVGITSIVTNALYAGVSRSMHCEVWFCMGKHNNLEIHVNRHHRKKDGTNYTVNCKGKTKFHENYQGEIGELMG
jgi:hypothetical protein